MEFRINSQDKQMKRKKYLLFVVFMAVWMINSADCNAFTPTDAIVNDKGINIRSEAGTNGTVVSSAAAGSRLRVCDAVTGQDGRTWYVVYINGNAKGYIRGDLLTLESDQGATGADSTASQDETQTRDEEQAKPREDQNLNASVGGKGKVAGDGVRIRGLNSTTSAIITVVSKNTDLTLLQKTVGSDAMTWYQVSLVQDGKTVVGYIRSDLVKIVNDVTQGTDNRTVADAASNGAVKGVNVNVRMQPVDGTGICKLSTGHSVEVMKETSGSDHKTWYYIRFTYGGVAQEGYIRSDFVIVEEGAISSSEERASDAEFSKKSATMKGINVRIRQSAVNGTVICQQSNGFALTIEGEMKGSDGNIWYQVSFSYQGKERQGYIRSDFVKPLDSESQIADTQFEEQLDQQGFPESYRVLLRALHEKHPNWSFQAVMTGLQWDSAVAAESRVGKNFVPKNSIVSYKSLETTAYSYKNDNWYTFDGGSWVAASKEVVAYYMDPRNFLTESGIYQFETLEYRDYQTSERVAAMLSSTFMKDSFTEPDGTTLSYADTFAKIGKEVGVNPYHLATRCYQEQGNGKGDSISGKVSGYTDIFNYFHIGAYAANGNTPVKQGIIYASKEDQKYLRPWNTRYKSLLGGAMYLTDKYISKKQNTLYFQKFNVVNAQNGIYSHQYMTNLLAASSEAARMKKAYGNADMDMEFIIPVYQGMPEQACRMPESNANPNNYLTSLTVGDGKLTPDFDGDVTEYTLSVGSKVSEVTIAASPVAQTSTVSGTGKVTLSKGTNTVSVVCRSASGSSRTYTVTITRK